MQKNLLSAQKITLSGAAESSRIDSSSSLPSEEPAFKVVYTVCPEPETENESI